MFKNFSLVNTYLAMVFGVCLVSGCDLNGQKKTDYATIEFESNNADLCLGKQLTALDPDGLYSDYQWTFSNGVQTGQTANHSFPSNGVHGVALLATGPDNRKALGSGTVNVDRIDLCGQIATSSLNQIDSDINEDFSTPVSNNGFELAQSIRIPGLVGGYMNVAGCGPTGLSQASGDSVDIYALKLTGQESINLELNFDLEATCNNGISQTQPNVTIDLFRSSDTSTAVYTNSDASVSKIILPEDYLLEGDYFLKLTLNSSASTYNLRIVKRFVATDSAIQDSTQSNFKNELIVKPQKGIKLESLQSLFSHSAPLNGHPDLLKINVTDENLEQFNSSNNLTQSYRNFSKSWEQNSVSKVKSNKLEWVKKQLESKEGIEWVAKNYIHKAAFTPADIYYNRQWHLPLMSMPQTWDAIGDLATNPPGKGVVVAVIDSGILPNHPDIDATRFADQFDFVSDQSSSGDGDGRDEDASDPGSPVFGQSVFHGTHVAGSIAAMTNLSPPVLEDSGVASVAWGVELVPIRVLDQFGEGTTTDIADAILWAAGLIEANGRLINKKADIINLSLGRSGSPNPVELSAIEQARNAGVIVVAAAGNESNDLPFYPAAYAGVIAVSSVDAEKQQAGYSNFGDYIDVAAPGGNLSADSNLDGFLDGILSTYGSSPTDYNYDFLQGTSMAAPQISGIFAIMKQLETPETPITPATLDAALQQGLLTEDLGTPGFDTIYGYGMINGLKAALFALDGADSPIMVANPPALNFTTQIDQLVLTLENGGASGLQLQNQLELTPANSWLAIEASNVASDGLGSYTVSIDREGLDDGTYLGNIRIRHNGLGTGELNIPISFENISNLTAGNSGNHFVILVDPNNRDLFGNVKTLREYLSKPVNGIYDYHFIDVEPGTYQIVAGSDVDNDFSLCDNGEACGGYPSFLERSDIEIPEEAENSFSTLHFSTSFPQSGTLTSTKSSIQSSHVGKSINLTKDRSKYLRQNQP